MTHMHETSDTTEGKKKEVSGDLGQVQEEHTGSVLRIKTLCIVGLGVGMCVCIAMFLMHHCFLLYCKRKHFSSHLQVEMWQG